MKKLLLIVLAVLLAVSMISCGVAPDETDAPETDVPVTDPVDKDPMVIPVKEDTFARDDGKKYGSDAKIQLKNGLGVYNRIGYINFAAKESGANIPVLSVVLAD